MKKFHVFNSLEEIKEVFKDAFGTSFENAIYKPCLSQMKFPVVVTTLLEYSEQDGTRIENPVYEAQKENLKDCLDNIFLNKPDKDISLKEYLRARTNFEAHNFGSVTTIAHGDSDYESYELFWSSIF